MTRRTRVKICGLTRREDVEAAIALGADALGFVLYAKSPRYVPRDRLAELTAGLPPFVSRVGLFVNAPRAEVRAVLEHAELDVLQFHGDERAADCVGYGRPYLRAVGVTAALDLLEFERCFPNVQALLLDTPSTGYGGSGKVFDWSLIPAELAHRAVLSGGLNAQNVAEAVRRVRPFAVDVSSGVEAAKGVKDLGRLRDFFEQVARADAMTTS